MPRRGGAAERLPRGELSDGYDGNSDDGLVMTDTKEDAKRKLGLATGSQLVQYAVNWCAGRNPGSA